MTSRKKAVRTNDLNEGSRADEGRSPPGGVFAIAVGRRSLPPSEKPALPLAMNV